MLGFDRFHSPWNMNWMNGTKQNFCVSAVLLYTITILQITLLLLDSVCNFGIQIHTSQMTFFLNPICILYSRLYCLSYDVKLFIQIKYCLH